MRLLGALVKRGGVTWFYKLVGPDEVVGPESERFEAFTRSTRFIHDDSAHNHDHDHPPAAGGTPTMAPPPQGQPPLPEGHPPVPGMPGAGAQTQPALPDGHPPVTGMPAGLPPARPVDNQVGALSYELPGGWQRQPDRPMRDATFTVGSGKQTAEVVVSHFPQGVGDTLSNVNRWRQQIGMGPVSEVDAAAQGQAVQIAGQPGRVYDFAGEGEGAMRQMVATCNKGGMEWFFKIIGPSGVVESNKQAFLQFLSSVRLGD